MKRIISLFIAALMLLPCIVNAANVQLPQAADSQTFEADYVLAFNPSTDKNNAKSTGSVTDVKSAGGAPEDIPLSRDRVIPLTDEQQALLAQQREKGAVCTREFYSVGDTRTWIAIDEKNKQHELNFECVGVGEHCYVWSVTDEGQYPINPEFIEPLAQEFDKQCPVMSEAFGDYYTPDGSGMVNLLCYDIIDGSYSPANGWIAGYFYAWDMFSFANNAAILHLDSFFMNRDGLENAFSIMAHEFQHLTNYSVSGRDMAPWLNECMSLSAQELCYPDSAVSYYISSIWNSSLFSRVDTGMSHFNFDDSYDAYCNQILFGQYLRAQTGGYTVFRDILHYFADGHNEFEAVVSALEGTALDGYTIDEIIMNYRLALVCKQPEGIYGFCGDTRMDKLKNNTVKGKQTVYGCGGVVYQPVQGNFTIPENASAGLVFVPIKGGIPVTEELAHTEPVSSVPIETDETIPVYDEKQSEHLEYTIEEDVNVIEVRHSWYDEKEKTFSFDKFLPDRTYSQYWEFKAEAGYKFTFKTTVRINGSDNLVDFDRTGINENGRFCVWTKAQYAVDTDKDYAKLVRLNDVTVIPALGGECCAYTNCTLFDTDKVKVTSTGWYNVTDDCAMTDSDVFAADKEYRFCISVETKDDCKFTEQTLVLINLSDEYIGSVEFSADNPTKLSVTTKAVFAAEFSDSAKAFLLTDFDGEFGRGLYYVDFRTGNVNLINYYLGDTWLCMQEVGGKYYAYNGQGEFIVADAETDEILRKETPENATGMNDMTYNSDDGQLYVTDSLKNSINVINTETGEQHKVITLDFMPWSLAYFDGYFYTVNTETSDVMRISDDGSEKIVCNISGHTFCGTLTMEHNPADGKIYILGCECISDEEGRRGFTIVISPDGTYTETKTSMEFSCLSFPKDETADIRVVPVTGISLDRKDATLYDSGDNTIQLIAEITPANATNGNIAWNSALPDVASVENGLVTAHSEGLTVVVAHTEDGEFFAFCTVKVVHSGNYTVTFIDGLTDEIIATDQVEEGADAVFPEPPEHDGYAFTGWDGDGKNITADVTITAQYALTGDLNDDGKVNTADAVVVLKYAAGMITLDEKQNLAGDTNHDGKVNTADAVVILKYAAGMITEL